MDQSDLTHFMPAPIKIVCADQSETMRRLLNIVLSADPEMQICQEVSNGREAVFEYQAHLPDVVLLDVEMPVMDGIEAVAAIRRLDSRVPIIMFSTLTSNCSEATLDALTVGATDYVTKPSKLGHVSAAFVQLRRELVPKIKRWGRWFQGVRMRQTFPATLPYRQTQLPSKPQNESARRRDYVDVVAIGISTGGPSALATLLHDIPDGFRTPILIVMHMPASFTPIFAESMNRICPLQVREAFAGAVVEEGQVWIAAGDQHMVTQKIGSTVYLQLNHGPHENSCRPSVDVLFRSVAETYRERSLAIVMTGMGQDGLMGCRRIRESGGRVFAQDEDSSVVWGMPRAVVKAGLADRVVPLDEMAEAMKSVVRLSMAAPAESIQCVTG